MEFVGQPRPARACNLLGVPGPSLVDLDDDEGEIVIGIRPKSSPLPRRKSSLSDDDSEPMPPLSGSRRVSFADAKGLNLVQVKEFDIWDIPKLPDFDSSEGRDKDLEEYSITSHNFSPLLPSEELFAKVRDQKLELESIELLPGTTILRGVIRVLNISFDKMVYVRTTLDSWSTHFDLLAEYIPGSSEGLMDCFSFRLTLVPPFGEQGARVDFCLRYETPFGAFWANNNGGNYVLFCNKRAKEETDKPQQESAKKKGCLKIVSQNFFTVENFSGMGASFQENIKTDVSKQGEEAETLKAKRIFDGQSGTLEEDDQKIPTKSRRNCSRRNRRKAARMARVREYFSERSGVNNPEKEDLWSEVKQTAGEELPSDAKSLSEWSSRAEDSRFVSGSVETNSESLTDVLQDMSPAHDYTSSSQAEKSEIISLADSPTLKGGESASDIPDDILNSKDEYQDINKSVYEAVESRKDEDVCQECTNDFTPESLDSFVSAVSGESLGSGSNSVTFGTVVAPLYHQAFGRAGTESEGTADLGNASKDTLNICPEKQVTRCTATTDTSESTDAAKGNMNKVRESLDAFLRSSPMEEDETSLSTTPQDILNRAESLQVPNEITYSNQRIPAEADPNAVYSLNTDVLDTLILAGSSDLQGESQEETLTRDLRSQTTEEMAEAQPSEQTSTQVKTNPDETHAQPETKETVTSLDTFGESERFNHETGQQTSRRGETEENISKTLTRSARIDVKVSETLHDLNLNFINNSDGKSAVESYDSCLEALQGKDVTTCQLSLKTKKETYDAVEANKVANSTKEAESLVMRSDRHIRGDINVETEGGDTPKQEEMSGLGKIEHHNLAEFCSADVTVVKNWEMMVEEEEINILTYEEESEGISIRAGDIEAVEEDHIEQLWDVVKEMTSENRDTAEEEDEKTHDEDVQERGEVENEAEAVDVSEDREEQIVEGVKDRARKMEETELTKRTDPESKDDPKEKEQDFPKIEEVNFERTNIQEEEEIEKVEERHLSFEEEGLENEGVKRKREKTQENPDNTETSQIIDAGDKGSENMREEDRKNVAECFEDRSESSQIEVEDDSSALVNNVPETRDTEKENAREAQSSHIQSEPYTEGEFQTNEGVERVSPKADRGESQSTFAGEGLCIFDNKPDNDQTGLDDAASSESDSDDEVELYMHCLRAVHTGAQAAKDGNKDAGFGMSKKPSVNRSKLLSTPMPSITESVDEEQNFSCLQDDIADTETLDFQPTAAPPAAADLSLDGALSVLRRVRQSQPISSRVVARYAGSPVRLQLGKGEASGRGRRKAASAARCGAMDLRDNVETGETENQQEMFYMPIPDEAPCKKEQEKLSGVVKNVHRKLRRKYREVGDFDKIWREHCEDEQTLSEYALAMKNLADNHWTKNCEGEGRIEWCRSVCQEYFLDGGMKRMLEKDEKSAALAMGLTAASVSTQPHTTIPSSISQLGKMRLLDVGSCFNPFLKFDEFLTVGIDIVPAVESVYKCDFLNLQLQQPLQLAGDAVEAFLRQLQNPIDTLPSQLFHVVVFSLLLSYFPSPYQRWICCKKAHELLELHGLLLIITPDSSHQNRHALMMRSWRVAVESLGFKRYKYIKYSHMHLIAFRKVCLATTSDLVSRNYPEMLYIPQDFHSNEEEECADVPVQVRSEFEEDQLAWGFTELPDTPYDSDSGESQSSSVPGFHELEDPILLQS
ncbi:hypothetical protein F2P81_006483 [Xyrichtys novacula]|uniref:S-adenosylmethionine sensor upstream of mTORC1 n=1 Tax=Xyrichtys novacula TaxID=13765 RepID=A0AAV1F5P7_XYRNO|nr:hypothetical protein F2P81_006483 [Xyrichtys novacula]